MSYCTTDRSTEIVQPRHSPEIGKAMDDVMRSGLDELAWTLSRRALRPTKRELGLTLPSLSVAMIRRTTLMRPCCDFSIKVNDVQTGGQKQCVPITNTRAVLVRRTCKRFLHKK